MTMREGAAGAAEIADGADKDDKDIVQRVVDGVVFCIRAGQMVPGQHLVEADLTRRFGVSRGSLREGLKQLSSLGIVTLSRYRGAFISVLDRKGVQDLLDVLEPLCALAARLAAENAGSAESLRELRAIARDMGRIVEQGSRADYLQRRRDFYDELVRMGGNSELGRVIPLARTDLFRAQFEAVQTKEQRRRHAAGYMRIVDAVAAGQAGRAERAVARHFAGTRSTLVGLSDRDLGASAAAGS